MVRKLTFVPLFVIAVALLVAPAASAHKTTYSADGKIKVVWGFLNEPAVTFTKTGLDLMLLDNATGAPIDGVTSSTLKVEMHHGEDEMEFKDFGAQFGTHGRYTGVITLTQPGIYILHLTGTINGSAVDMEIPAAHDVEDIQTTYFPAMNSTDATIKDLTARVTALEAKAKTSSETTTTLTTQPSNPSSPVPAPALGLVAVGLVAAVLALRRRT